MTLAALLTVTTVNTGSVMSLAAEDVSEVILVEDEQAQDISADADDSDSEEVVIDLEDQESAEDEIVVVDDEEIPSDEAEEVQAPEAENEIIVENDGELPFKADELVVNAQAEPVNVSNKAPARLLPKEATAENVKKWEEWAQDKTFTWKAEKPAVINYVPVDRTTATYSEYSEKGAYEIELLGVSKGYSKLTLTVEGYETPFEFGMYVEDAYELSSYSVELALGRKPSEEISLTIKNISKEKASSLKVEITDIIGEKIDIAEASISKEGTYDADKKEYKISYMITAKEEGTGYIWFSLQGYYSAYADLSVEGLEKVMLSNLYGFNNWGDEPGEPDSYGYPATGEVINGDQVEVSSYTRGATIYYKIEYGTSVPAEVTAEKLISDGKVYEGPILINTSLALGYARISVIGVKAGLQNSDLISKVLYINQEWSLWRDVNEVDKVLFANDPQKVINSGIVISNIPDERHPVDDYTRAGQYSYYYTGRKITFDYDFRIYYDGFMLSPNDYKITYNNNVKVCNGPKVISSNSSAAVPTVTIKGVGDYSISYSMPFEIVARPINQVMVTSNPTIAVFANDKKIDSTAVPTLVFENDGTSLTLKKGTDYTVFYNKIVDGKTDFTKELTAEQLLADISANKDKDLEYLINAKGINGFKGVLAVSDDDTRGASILRVYPEAASTDLLSLNKATVSKLPVFTYAKDEKGNPTVWSKEIIKGFESGKFTIKVGKQVLKYTTAEAYAKLSAEDKKFGYYFTINDPYDYDDLHEINATPGQNNFVDIIPFAADGYECKLIGIRKLTFTIKGWNLAVKDMATSVTFTGSNITVYGDNGLDVKATLKNLAKKGKSTAAIVNKADGKVLSEDSYYMWADGNDLDAGTFTLVIQGRPDKGITGTLTKKIKITPKKLTKKDVVTDGPEANKLFVKFGDYNDYSYSKGGTKPYVIVSYGLDSEKQPVYLYEEGDYTVSYSNNKKAGAKAKVNLKLIRNYSGTLNNVLTFTVGTKEFTQENGIWANVPDKVWKDAKDNFKQTPVLYDYYTKLKAKSDYQIVGTPEYRYAEDFKDGDKVIYKGTEIKDGDKVGVGAVIEIRFQAEPKNKSYTKRKAQPKATSDGDASDAEWFADTYVIGKYDISKCKVKIADQTYRSGIAVVPSRDDIKITYKDGKTEKQLTQYEIYDIYDNCSVGTATIIFRGKGDFCGELKATFKIKRAAYK
jgi:hypothetical protein